MTPKLTDEQIFEAINYCKDVDTADKCKHCPIEKICGEDDCVSALADLLNRLKADNLQLNSDLIILENDYEHLKQNFDETVEKNQRLRMKLINAVNTIADLKRLLKRNGG